MNRNSLLVVLLCLMVLVCGSSCRSAYPYHSASCSPKIAALNPVVDTYSLEDAFGIAHSNTTSSNYGSFGATYNNVTPYSGTTYSKTTTYRDESIRDVASYCEKEINDYMCESGVTKGTAVIKVVSGGKHVNKGLSYLTIACGFGVLNLIGVPWAFAKGGLQLELSIYDRNNNRVAVYTSKYHKHTKVVALYYGYSSSGGMRQAIFDSVKECMDDIKEQVSRDASRINMNL